MQLGGVCDHMSFCTEADRDVTETPRHIDNRTICRLMEKCAAENDAFVTRNVSVCALLQILQMLGVMSPEQLQTSSLFYVFLCNSCAKFGYAFIGSYLLRTLFMDYPHMLQFATLRRDLFRTALRRFY